MADNDYSFMEFIKGQLEELSFNLEELEEFELESQQIKSNMEAASKIEGKQTDATIEMIPISEVEEIVIEEDNTQMFNRSDIDQDHIVELAHNIKSIEGLGVFGTGLLHPIVVNRKNDKYERVSGFRRIQAFILNDKTHIPAVVLNNVSENQARFMRNSENIKREQLNPYDMVINILENISVVLNRDIVESIDIMQRAAVLAKKQTKKVLEKRDRDFVELMNEVAKKCGNMNVRQFSEKLKTYNIEANIIHAMRRNEVNLAALYDKHNEKDLSNTTSKQIVKEIDKLCSDKREISLKLIEGMSPHKKMELVRNILQIKKRKEAVREILDEVGEVKIE